MDMLKRPLAVVLSLIAVAVLFNFWFSTFYEDSIDVDQVWYVLDWFMAFGVIVALVATYVRRRSLGADHSDNVSREYVCVNVAFYAAALLAIWFFWNWFDFLAASEDGQSQTGLDFWGFIDPLFIILMCGVSAHLWKDASHE